MYIHLNLFPVIIHLDICEIHVGIKTTPPTNEYFF